MHQWLDVSPGGTYRTGNACEILGSYMKRCHVCDVRVHSLFVHVCACRTEAFTRAQDWVSEHVLHLEVARPGNDVTADNNEVCVVDPLMDFTVMSLRWCSSG